MYKFYSCEKCRDLSCSAILCHLRDICMRFFTQEFQWDALTSSRNSEGPYTYHLITAVQTIQVKCLGSASSRRGRCYVLPSGQLRKLIKLSSAVHWRPPPNAQYTSLMDSSRALSSLPCMALVIGYYDIWKTSSPLSDNGTAHVFWCTSVVNVSAVVTAGKAGVSEQVYIYFVVLSTGVIVLFTGPFHWPFEDCDAALGRFSATQEHQRHCLDIDHSHWDKTLLVLVWVFVRFRSYIKEARLFLLFVILMAVQIYSTVFYQFKPSCR